MESLISTFHIDTRILISQIVNFGIVFAVLYFFAFKPIIKIMGERSDKIEKSLEEAKEIERKLAEADIKQKEIITEAKRQANLVMEDVSARGEEKKAEMVAKAKEEIGQLINSEKAKMARDKAETLKELKKEVADLVVLTVEKLLGEKMTEDKDKELIKKLVK